MADRTTPARLLVVEDDSEHFELARFALERAGYVVERTAGERETLARLADVKYQAILLDYLLPDGNGISLLSKIAVNDSAPPVIMVTAANTAELAVRALRAGASDYVVKGMDYLDELPGVISRVLERRNLEQVNKQLQEALLEQIRTDFLTGLNNRQTVLQRLETELDRASRYSRPLTLAMLDLDNFKSINDRFGHQAGDRVLMQIGQVLRAELRSSDFAGRYGGDEFVLVMPETDIEHASVVVERIRSRLEGQDVVPDLPRLRVSIGLAGASTSVEESLSRADAAMYQAKRRRRRRRLTNNVASG